VASFFWTTLYITERCERQTERNKKSYSTEWMTAGNWRPGRPHNAWP